MPRSGLRGDFGGNDPTQRFRTRNRELHVPKVYFRRDELHPDILLAVASPMDRDDTALHRLRGVIIHQDQRLSHQHDLFKLKQRPVPVHRLRMGLRGELLAGVCLSVDGQRHGQCYPQGTTTFFATKVKQGHSASTSNLIFESTTSDQLQPTRLLLLCRVSRVLKRQSDKIEVNSTNLAHTPSYCLFTTSKTMAERYHKRKPYNSTLVPPLRVNLFGRSRAIELDSYSLFWTTQSPKMYPSQRCMGKLLTALRSRMLHSTCARSWFG